MPTSLAEELSPGATQLVVTAHPRAMRAVMDMVTVQTQRLLATATRTDRDVGAALFRGKHRKTEVVSNPEAEGGTRKEGVW